MSADDLWNVTTTAMVEVTSASAWVERMIRVEAALSRALADVGAAPSDSTPTGARVDAAGIAMRARAAGTPVIPLVAELAEQFGPSVHLGATSQDIIDTGLALMARTALRTMMSDAELIAAALAALADDHRNTVVAGRTLLQQANPTSFGLVAAGWLTGFVDAWALAQVAVKAIPAQLGGPVGTLSTLGANGPEVLRQFASDLGLPEPTLPWHTTRQPVTRAATALAMLAGAVAKIAGDIVLHAQSDVGEVGERQEPGRGTSSAMPHKHNPVASVRALTAAEQVAPIAGGLLSSMGRHPFQRATGAWQAEVPALNAIFGHVAVALEALADALDGLHVDRERMIANLDASGSWAAEAATVALTPRLGREPARQKVKAAADAARKQGSTLRDELVALVPGLPDDVLEHLDDLGVLLGSSRTFIDRALVHYRDSVLHP